MKHIYTLIVVFSLSSFFLSKPMAAQSGWQLVWSDEFDGAIGPDWVFETGGGGWGNEELQYYRRENARVENGQLVITAKRENFGGRNYTSARMKTQGRKNFRYGRIEARLNVPYGNGQWPAFWMLGESISTVGWPRCGEIDIMEHINTEDKLFGTIHWSDNNNNYATYGGDRFTSLRGWHNYAIEWDDQSIKWFMDGQQFHEVNIAGGINGTEEFHEPHFLLLNFAIGGRFPGWNIDENQLPAEYRVDYVRVYERGNGGGNGGGGGGGTSSRIEAEDFYDMSGIQTEACSEGGLNVGYIDNGDWMAYRNISFSRSGTYEIEYRVAGYGGRLAADLNAGSIRLGEVNVPSTGGWQNWTSVRQRVYVNAGTYNLGVFASQSGWNLNWMNIRSLDGGRVTKSASKDQASLTAGNNTNGLLYPTLTDRAVHIAPAHYAPGMQVEIMDMAGRTVLSRPSLTDATISVDHLPAGTYLLRAHASGELLLERFVKR